MQAVHEHATVYYNVVRTVSTTTALGNSSLGRSYYATVAYYY